MDEAEIHGTMVYPTAGLAMGRIISEDWAIDACRPYWMNKFPEVAESSPESRKKVLAKLGQLFFGLR